MRAPQSERNTSIDFPAVTADILERLRERRPRVHCITNAVAQAFTANMLLAAGAVPSMTIALKEVRVFAARADALLVNLKGSTIRKLGLTYILVSHDLAVVAHLCERLLVMRHGEAVEETTAEALRSGAASNEYTQSLIQASQGYSRAARQPDAALAG